MTRGGMVLHFGKLSPLKAYRTSSEGPDLPVRAATIGLMRTTKMEDAIVGLRISAFGTMRHHTSGYPLAPASACMAALTGQRWVTWARMMANAVRKLGVASMLTL